MDEFRWRRFAAAGLVALVCAGLSVQTLLGAGFGRDPKIRAVRAKADAFVSAARRTSNFGRNRDLRVDASPRVRTYVKFSADLKSGDVRHVSLLLYSRTRSQAGYQLRLVGTYWRERSINFANAPGLSSRFVASGPLRARAWKAVDVTLLVEDEDGEVSFVLTSVSPKGAAFASRETGLHGPRLVVERNGNGNNTTGSTSTSGAMPPAPAP